MTPHPQNRRTPIIKSLSICIITILATQVSGQAESTKRPQGKPNILWLTSEDNNATYLGCYGNKHAVTPNIDKLAQEGFRYTHCYSNGAVCSASRSTWISGMISVSIGAHNHRSRVTPPKNLTFYPKALQQAGYHTGNFKKTDYNMPTPGKLWDSTKDPNWQELKNKQPFFQVINFAHSHESRAMGTSHTHDPAKTVIPPYHPDIKGIRANYAHYYDAITNLDRAVGAALKGLKDAGLDENTIVIHNSDHGGALPRGKRFMYNSGTHCPLIIRIPKKYKHIWPNQSKGTIVDRLVSFVDMPATWLSLAGAKIPKEYHGVVFLGKDTAPERNYHYSFRGRNDERIENARAIRDKRMLYIVNYIPYVPRGQHLTYQWRIPMQRFWEEHYKSGKANAIQSRYFELKAPVELYDTQKDPYCINNLAQHPEFEPEVKRLNSMLLKKQRDIYDAGLIPESELNKRASDNRITVYEAVRKKKLYPIKLYQKASSIALANDPSNTNQLIAFTNHPDSGMRYWGATGLMILGKDANSATTSLEKLLADSSHNVRVMAAWALIKRGNNDSAHACINALIKEKSYAMMEILNIVDWMETDRKAFLPAVKTVQSKNEMINWMKNYLIRGQEKPRTPRPTKGRKAGKQ